MNLATGKRPGMQLDWLKRILTYLVKREPIDMGLVGAAVQKAKNPYSRYSIQRHSTAGTSSALHCNLFKPGVLLNGKIPVETAVVLVSKLHNLENLKPTTRL